MSTLFDIYKNPRLYDDQYWWKKDDIEFYKSLIPPGSTALELASGTGRLSRPLFLNNVSYHGLEISREFYLYSREHHSIDNSINFINADMIDFDLDNKFDRIFIAFNSFNHIMNEEDALSCLKNIKNHLKEGGIFIADIINPHPMFLFRSPEDRVVAMDFKDSSNGELVEVYEVCKYNHETEVCSITWDYVYSTNTNFNKKLNFNMKMYYPDTMNRMLIDAGFSIDYMYGNFRLEKFTEHSASQIYICK